MNEPRLALHEPIGDSVKTTTCYMCACRCGIRVHLKDGRIRYIEGNRDHPVNRGVLCAKGSAGIQQHESPARLRKPLLRVGARGAGEFREIEWEEALSLACEWLGAIRERNPDELAFFTGRDQSQALTGWWAQQFGTVNYAAHGGFCSVNMAAAGMYTFGSSFWEFGEPDYEHTQYLMMWGVAEDHDSNPIKIQLGKLKARGAKIVSINPVRTGYAALADEWIAIRPGTDGALILALVHELLRINRIDLDYLVRYTDAHHLVIDAPGTAEDGTIARDELGRALAAFHHGKGEDEIGVATRIDASPRVVGRYTLADGRVAHPVFHLLAERYLDPQYAPEAAAQLCGVDAATIRRLAAELAHNAFDRAFEMPVAWTDTAGRRHPSMTARPVAMHAMRGISAHSNGFQTCRALHVLQLLLGAIESPGSFRSQPPYPKGTPPANRPGRTRKDNGALDAAPLGYPRAPEDLLVDANGQPRRIDRAFSWEHPLAIHGLLHSVIRNAHDGNPYPIDTLFLFMANMGWNSAMATSETQDMLRARRDDGSYVIPRVIYSDAYFSETVQFADLVLPDTTYLERHDCISLLDRPISDADGVADGMRSPVMAPDRDVRPFQSVLLDLGARLGLPGMVDEQGAPRYPGGFAQFMVEHERAPGIGLLAGWRGAAGDAHGKGGPNPQQLERYIEHGHFWREEMPDSARYFKFANRDYMEWAADLGLLARPASGHFEALPVQLYAETLQHFRNAARGHGASQPPEVLRSRVERYFDPLPFWYAPIDHARIDLDQFPLHAITQRPMFMYHAWGSQNRWLRQIAARNALYVHPRTAAALGLADGDEAELSSPVGRMIVPIALHEGVALNTVWTWNAIGKRRGAWALGDGAPEHQHGFLINSLIHDQSADRRHANADPITGQAAWFDQRVALRRLRPDAP